MTIDTKNYGSFVEYKLSFKKDNIPRNYSSIRERLELPRKTFSGFINSTPLSDYFKEVELLEVDKTYGTNDLKRTNRKVSIKTNKRRMSLDIKVRSEEFLGLDQLLDVNNLHDFIVTGEYPKK